MKRPLLLSLIAAVVLASVTVVTDGHGAVGGMAHLLAVYFGLDFLFLLGHNLFAHRDWRLSPPLPWMQA